MTKPLDERYTSILQARDRQEFLCGLVRFGRSLGFTTINALTVVDSPRGAASRFLSINNFPSAAMVLDTPANGQRDPLMQHCKRSSLPFVWDRATYLNAGQVDLWESFAGFGFCCGLALATHRPVGRHFMLSVERDQSLPRNPREVSRRLADLALFAAFAEDVASRVLTSVIEPVHEVSELSRRELECLRWTGEGKTAWEVGNILGISEQTAAWHLCNAARKLDCVNKHQAMVKALRLGLIQ